MFVFSFFILVVDFTILLCSLIDMVVYMLARSLLNRIEHFTSQEKISAFASRLAVVIVSDYRIV